MAMKLAIDLEEIYIALLKRNCTIVQNTENTLYDMFQIIEDNDVGYYVRLIPNR